MNTKTSLCMQGGVFVFAHLGLIWIKHLKNQALHFLIMKYIFLLFLSCAMGVVVAQPVISFTFDDGSTADRPGYAFEDWNALLLGRLEDAGVRAVFFVTGHNKLDGKGRHLLQSWNDKGHRIANHTFSHPNYNSEQVSAEAFAAEFLKNDSLIRAYSQFLPLFRFPYLKEGNTVGKVTAFRALMQAQGYQNGYVTIDASDWYIDSRLNQRLRENPEADISGYRQYYLDHLLDRATYYETLAYDLTGRHIRHTLLLHHNLAAALFLDDLVALFREKGWQVIDADTAFEDPIFEASPAPEFVGESLIWSLAKANGRLAKDLRYPAEDSRYEKEKMDVLGL